MNRDLLLGAVADDYTGGSDLASMLRERGVRTVQVLGLQSDDFAETLRDYQAVVISLKSRSLPAPEACALSLRAVDQLTRLRARQVQFKYCSTFDSTRQGNIGPVIDTLMDRLASHFTLAVPALPVNGRTQYLGHLFVGNELLSESPLRHHPLTPMTDSNLVRHLQSQTRRKVGLIAFPTVQSGAEKILQECCRLEAEGIEVALVDALTEDNLDKIAEAAVDFPLITGGSGLGMALPCAWARRGWLKSSAVHQRSRCSEQTGSVLILSGSCSTMTLQQIQSFRESGGTLVALNVPRLLSHGPTEEAAHLLSAVEPALQHGKPVLVFSSAGPADRAQVLLEAGRDVDEVHQWIEKSLAAVAAEVVQRGLSQRLIVAGGETSGAVVDALKIQAVEVLAAIDPGVPCLKSVGSQPLALALKSGNFGSLDFFNKAVTALRGISLSKEGGL